MNKLIISADFIELDGFDKLGSEITFAFYPKGISIFNGKKDYREYYYSCTLSESKTINDPELLNKLSSYNLNNHVIFIYSGDSYLEMNPSIKK